MTGTRYWVEPGPYEGRVEVHAATEVDGIDYHLHKVLSDRISIGDALRYISEEFAIVVGRAIVKQQRAA